MRRLGWAIDWDREVSAHEPTFYRWTQWLFLKLFEHDLAYRKAAPVNWCPNDQTVLSNEHVIDGRCERCGAEVEARNMEQWFFKITSYADALLEGHARIDWPERTKKIQSDWIGRSEGAEVLFRVDELDLDIPVFTTRPDTLFGATFFVLAPESPLVELLIDGTDHADEVRAYARIAGARSTADRETREKSGVFTGRYATNPVDDEQIPIWVADYVLMEYGTGAIMAVPAHDERDREFAERLRAADRAGHRRRREARSRRRSSTGCRGRTAKRAIIDWLGEQGRGRQSINYRLRDWSFSRQRYWGCPIPILYCDDCGVVPVPEEDLPVLLPDVENYRPKGEPPLASNLEWLWTECPRCGGRARREADTMDTFVDSSWYFLRYCDPRNDTAPFDREIVDYWMPVDQYVGGIDHAKGHLLYSRFFIKVLNDLGLVGFDEPFQRLFHQGWVKQGGTKMSKSKGNVTGPDALVEAFGADAVRLYILFLGPADQDMEWTDDGADGMRRFVARLWRTVLAAADRPAWDGERDAAGAQGARDDRPRHRRHRPPVRLQHAHRGRDGARQRAVQGPGRPGRPPRRRDGRDADPAVRAPRRRGAVVAPRPRAAVGGAVAVLRRVAAEARHDPARRPGERQGARPPRGARRAPRGRADRAREGLRTGAGAPERRGAPGVRRPGQARQLRRLESSSH